MRTWGVALALLPLLAAGAAAQPRLDALGDPLPPGAVARLGTTRLRHEGLVGAAFHPNGKTLVSTAYGTTPLLFWDAATGRLVLAPELPPLPQQQLPVFSPDGKLLATVQG